MSSRRAKLLPLLLIPAAFLAYHNSFSGPFIFDDIVSIPGNPTIRSFWPLQQALWAPSHTTPAGRPIVNLSLALNYALGGLEVRGYHAFNLAVHLLAALVLYGIVRRTLCTKALKERFSEASAPLALAVSMIWLIHPLQTESVTYVIQRAESLVGLFYLLTLYCVIRGLESVRQGRWYAIAIGMCALGMATKEVMATAPLLVLLYDRIFWATSLREVLRRRWKLHASLAATALIVLALIAAGPRLHHVGGRSMVTGLDYMWSQCEFILRHLQLVIWPSLLVLDYGWPNHRELADVLPFALGLAVLVGSVIWAMIRRPMVGFLGVWFLLILTPSATFFPGVTQVASEHRMYLPLAAPIILLVVIAHALLRRLVPRRHAWVTGTLILGAVVSGLSMLTISRNEDYKTAIGIWEDTVRKRPQNSRAHYNLGSSLLEAGRLEEAIPHYRTAVRISPGSAMGHFSLGVALGRQGKAEAAIQSYRRTVEIDPEYAKANNNWGAELLNMGRQGEAVVHFEKALRSEPTLADAHHNLGLALARQGRPKDAAEEYRAVLRIQPDHVNAHYYLGIALTRSGDIGAAQAAFRNALRLRPDWHLPAYKLGWILATHPDPAVRRPEEAIRLAELACRATNLQDPWMLDTLGAALAAAGDFQQAIRTSRQALSVATRLGKSQYAGKIKNRLLLYEKGQAYQEWP